MLVHLGDEAYRLVFVLLQVIGLPANASSVNLVNERYTKNQKRKYRKQKPCSHWYHSLIASNKAGAERDGSRMLLSRARQVRLRGMRELRHDTPL
jgi:hypothetical protein